MQTRYIENKRMKDFLSFTGRMLKAALYGVALGLMAGALYYAVVRP